MTGQPPINGFNTEGHVLQEIESVISINLVVKDKTEKQAGYQNNNRRGLSIHVFILVVLVSACSRGPFVQITVLFGTLAVRCPE